MTQSGYGAVPSPPRVAAAAAPIGYVLKVFPRVSETFVINEIRALEARGEAVRVFSLHHPTVTVPHGILRELRAPVVYVEDTLPEETDVAAARRRLQRQLDIADAQRETMLPRKYVRLAVALSAAARAAGVTHLHAHFASRAGHVAALAARLAGCSFSLTAHAKDLYHADVDPVLLRWKLSEAAVVVTVTDYNRRHLDHLLADLPGAAARVVRLYNGVDLDRFRPDGEPDVPPLFLGVGRLVEKKGFPVLVEACRLLRQRGLVFACDIIGDGPDAPVLRERIEAAGLADVVTLRGTVTTEDVALALRRATAAVLPCLVARDGNVDALPTVLLEAMATARPVVSTRLSGIPEIVVDGVTGLLVPPGDAAALADALARLLTDPHRARTMGAAGRQRAAELFDLWTNAAVLQEHFDTIRSRGVPA